MKTIPLQWGRNLTVAEGAEFAAMPLSEQMLQWGRNLTVAEGAVAPSQWGPR